LKGRIVNFLCTPFFISSLGANILHNTVFSNTLQDQPVFYLKIRDEVLQVQNRR
jgi:hypothetical protein